MFVADWREMVILVFPVSLNNFILGVAGPRNFYLTQLTQNIASDFFAERDFLMRNVVLCPRSVAQ